MILVFLVVYLFLQNWRATLIPTLAVPVSLIGTMAGLQLLGYSINTLTLFGMVLAIGIVVDDAIVVLENVERLMHEEGMTIQEAAIEAMQEVTGPVIAIVLVLVAAFGPIAFLGGLAGELYRQFSVTISIAVVLSGLVALTLTPALCVVFLKREEPAKNRFFVWFNRFFKRVTHGYIGGVSFILRRAMLGTLLVCRHDRGHRPCCEDRAGWPGAGRGPGLLHWRRDPARGRVAGAHRCHRQAGGGGR